MPPEAKAFLESLHPRTGTIPLPEAKATLELGDDYLFYGPADAERIIVDAWGNPPTAGDGVLGLVMPAGTTPLSDAWGAVVTYESTGYVSDEDAADADYAAILAELKEGTAANNADRRAEGYPEIEVIGWAEDPKYDKLSHSVVWARDLKFGRDETHALNYDFRSLGRHGVLSINVISSMPELANVRIAARDFASHAHFDAGARYEDFDSTIDRKAEYGIGGLVAAGVGVAAAKKAGLLALLLKFLKPILVGIAVLFGTFFRKVKRLFGLDDSPSDAEWEAYANDPAEGEFEASEAQATQPSDADGVT
ncbi:MAG: DUF2167 domain-containing protein [Porphyrobacter sp.]|nr:DUF2167 domain-containing protein [Porphyrobacter sp.]